MTRRASGSFFRRRQLCAILAGAAMAVATEPAGAAPGQRETQGSPFFLCIVQSVQDGDTLRCTGDIRVRLAAIDAPDVPRTCRRNRSCGAAASVRARERLRLMTNAQVLRCDEEAHTGNRVTAWCWRSDGIQLNCAMARSGLAVFAARYDDTHRLCTAFAL